MSSSSKHARRARPGRGGRRTPSLSSFSESPLHPPLLVHHLRVEQALRERLASLLRDGLQDPHLEGLWLVALELSGDGRHARASVALEPREVSAQGREARVLPALARAAGFLRAELAQGLDLKRLPALRFTLLGVLPSELPGAGGDGTGEGGEA